MKRKLIEYEVFEKMRENSLSAAVNELAECEDQLARALDRESLVIESFDDGSVIYETDQGTFIKANYQIDKKSIKFDNIEELVINEETEKKEVRNVVEQLLEALLDDNESKAGQSFEKYMGLAHDRYKRNGTLCTDSKLDEAWVRVYSGRGRGGKTERRVSGAPDPDRSRRAKEGHRKHGSSYKQGVAKRRSHKHVEDRNRKKRESDRGRLSALSGGKQYRSKTKLMKEWLDLSNNVFGFIDWKENGFLVKETHVRTNEHGEVVAVRLPNSRTRNEGKIQHQKYNKMMNTDLKVLRESARRLSADESFCRAVADIKRFNNISDDSELEESIGNLVSQYPSVLYLTQDELAHTIGTALSNIGVSNYDDQTCSFMAEGILRVAHGAYSDRVEKIMQFANQSTTTEGDAYLHFQKAATSFFPSLDESIDLERKVFEDLYSATCQVRTLALESRNDIVRNEAQEFISELENILSGREASDIDLAEEVAGWLNQLAESNMTGSSWEVVKTPHHTVTGDHPQMAKNAKVPGIPGQNEGEWGDPAPMIHQDKKGYKGSSAPDEARHRSWGNKGGKEVWPSLSNPNIPSPFGDYTMKGERGADKDTDNFGTWSSNSTFPGLQNPYVPSSVKVHVNSDNRVDS